jgi:hypothetical protein
MPGHKEKAIADMINSTVELQDKWNALILKLETHLKEQFKEALGVPVPSSLMCDVYHFDSSAEFAANADVDEYKKGASAIISSVFKTNWPQVALDVIDTVAGVAGRIIGSGTLKVGVTADAHKLDANNQTGEKTFMVACYSVTQECTASDWRLNTNFYAASHVLAVWAPTMPHLTLISNRLKAHSDARLLL